MSRCCIPAVVWGTESQVCRSHLFLGGLQPFSKTCLGSSRLHFVRCCSEKSKSSFEASRHIFFVSAFCISSLRLEGLAGVLVTDAA